MEIMIYLANTLYVIAYFTTDLLRLRLLTVSGASCLAVYFYAGQPEPMWNVVGWNLFFVALNLIQVARVIGSRTTLGTAKP